MYHLCESKKKPKRFFFNYIEFLTIKGRTSPSPPPPKEVEDDLLLGKNREFYSNNIVAELPLRLYIFIYMHI